MNKQQTTPELPDNIAIPHPDGSTVRVIRLVRSGSDRPMSPDEEIILAQYREIERLKSGQRVTAAPQEGVSDWGIDSSTGRPVLVHKNCSVIESEEAFYVLHLIAADRIRADAPEDSSLEMSRELEVFRRKHFTHWNAAENLLIAHAVARLSIPPAVPPPLSPPDTGNVGAKSLDLTTLFELGKVYANICASPHHMTFSVESLRSLIESLAPPPGRGMVPMTEEQAVACVAKVYPVVSRAREFWQIENDDAVAIVRAAEQFHGIKEAAATPLGDGGREA